MPEQILLQGKILGTEEFLLAGPAEGRSARSAGEDLLAGRSQWITLLCEVLPRALLAELGLAAHSARFERRRPVPAGAARRSAARRPRAFLTAAAAQISELSSGRVKLIWAVTDNLGDWAVIRKRLNEELQRKRNAPLAAAGAAAFQPFSHAPARRMPTRISRRNWAPKCARHRTVGWSPENPGKVMPGEGKHTWSLTSNLSPDGIMLARHAAPSRRRQAGRAGADAGAPRAGPLHLGRAARRRGQFRPAAAPRAFASKSTCRFRCCTSSSSPANWKCCARCRSSGARSASSIPAATISRCTAPGTR